MRDVTLASEEAAQRTKRRCATLRTRGVVSTLRRALTTTLHGAKALAHIDSTWTQSSAAASVGLARGGVEAY
jgi:hypothetical protein